MKTFKEIEREQYNVRSFDDQRRRVNRLIVVFTDGKYDFVKRFEFPTQTSYHEMLLEVPKSIK